VKGNSVERHVKQTTAQDIVSVAGCIAVYYAVAKMLIMQVVLSTSPAYLRNALPTVAAARTVEEICFLLVAYAMILSLCVYVSLYRDKDTIKRALSLLRLRLSYSKKLIIVLILHVIFIYSALCLMSRGVLRGQDVAIVVSVVAAVCVCIYADLGVAAGYALAVGSVVVVMLMSFLFMLHKSKVDNYTSGRIEILKDMDSLEGVDIQSFERVGDVVYIGVDGVEYVVPWGNIGAVKHYSK
jgi:hypothetical protein